MSNELDKKKLYYDNIVVGKDAVTDKHNIVGVDSSGNVSVRQLLTAAIPQEWDEVNLTYTGADLTGVVYKYLGATVATLALTVVAGNITKVVRS
jgi:hypothetical protein